MNKIRQKLGPLLILIVVVAFVVACGDEDDLDDADNDAELNVQEHDDEDPDAEESDEDEDEGEGEGEEDEETTAEDCDEGQVYNPMSGECITPDVDEDPDPDPDSNNGNDDNGNNDDNANLGNVNAEPNQEENHAQECGPGSIEGQTCRPDGGVLPGAQVRVEGNDCDGFPFIETVTADGQGNYEFHDIPSGTHELTIESGSFVISEDVSVAKGQVTDRKSDELKLCLQGTEVDIAVVSGSFDDIASILDGMTIEYSWYSGSEEISSLFGDIDEMQNYDIIFVECGAPWSGLSSSLFDTDMDEVRFNINRYVELGNSLYASDQAHGYIEETLEDAIVFYNHDSSSSPRVGNGSQYITADVVSDEMQTLLNSDTTELYFNLGAWAVAEGVGPMTDIHFRGDAEITGGVVEGAALMSSYRDPIGDGRAIYTSFHNSAQVDGEMQDILEFMIFQL